MGKQSMKTTFKRIYLRIYFQEFLYWDQSHDSAKDFDDCIYANNKSEFSFQRSKNQGRETNVHGSFEPRSKCLREPDSVPDETVTLD